MLGENVLSENTPEPIGEPLSGRLAPQKANPKEVMKSASKTEATDGKSRVKKVKRLSEDQIRINHVSSEKKRRELVRAIYDELVTLVPGLQKNENRSELIIYQKTINYLSWLYEKNEALRGQLQSSTQVSEELVWELPPTATKRQTK